MPAKCFASFEPGFSDVGCDSATGLIYQRYVHIFLRIYSLTPDIVSLAHDIVAYISLPCRGMRLIPNGTVIATGTSITNCVFIVVFNKE